MSKSTGDSSLKPKAALSSFLRRSAVAVLVGTAGMLCGSRTEAGPSYPPATPYPAKCADLSTSDSECCAYQSWTTSVGASYPVACEVGAAYDASAANDKTWAPADTARTRATLVPVRRADIPIAPIRGGGLGGTYVSQTLPRSLVELSAGLLVSSQPGAQLVLPIQGLPRDIAASILQYENLNQLFDYSVHSCEDFVEKRWWDYSHFVSMLRMHGTDYAAAFSDAYHDPANGIADNRPLYAYAPGFPLQPTPLPLIRVLPFDNGYIRYPAHGIPRNPYLLPLPRQVQDLIKAQGGVLSPAVSAEIVLPSNLDTTPTEFTLHALINDSQQHHFGTISPNEYAEGERRSIQFGKLLAQEAKLQKTLFCLDNPGAASCNASLAAEIKNLPAAPLPAVPVFQWIPNPAAPGPGVVPVASPQVPPLLQIAELKSAMQIGYNLVSAPGYYSGDTIELRSQLADIVTATSIRSQPLIARQLGGVSLLAELQILRDSLRVQGSNVFFGQRAAALDTLVRALQSGAIQGPRVWQRPPRAPSAARQERLLLQAQLQDVQSKLAAAYIAEQARGEEGCLWPGDTSANGVAANLCDWSPKLFVERFKSILSNQLESDYALCVKHTGNDFSPNGVLHNATVQQSTLYPFDFRGKPFTSSIGEITPPSFLSDSDKALPAFKHPGLSEFLEHMEHADWYHTLQNQDVWKARQQLSGWPLLTDDAGRTGLGASSSDASSLGDSNWVALEVASSSSWTRYPDPSSYAPTTKGGGGNYAKLNRLAAHDRVDEHARIDALGTFLSQPMSINLYGRTFSADDPNGNGDSDSKYSGSVTFFDYELWKLPYSGGGGNQWDHHMVFDPTLELQWSIFGCDADQNSTDELIVHWYDRCTSGSWDKPKVGPVLGIFFEFDAGFLLDADEQIELNSEDIDFGQLLVSGARLRKSDTRSKGLAFGIYGQLQANVADLDWLVAGGEVDIDVLKATWQTSTFMANQMSQGVATIDLESIDQRALRALNATVKVYVHIKVPLIGEKGVEATILQTPFLLNSVSTHENTTAQSSTSALSMVMLQQ